MFGLFGGNTEHTHKLGMVPAARPWFLTPAQKAAQVNGICCADCNRLKGWLDTLSRAEFDKLVAHANKRGVVDATPAPHHKSAGVYAGEFSLKESLQLLHGGIKRLLKNPDDESSNNDDLKDGSGRKLVRRPLPKNSSRTSKLAAISKQIAQAARGPFGFEVTHGRNAHQALFTCTFSDLLLLLTQAEMDRLKELAGCTHLDALTKLDLTGKSLGRNWFNLSGHQTDQRNMEI